MNKTQLIDSNSDLASNREVALSVQQFSGPLPPPQILKEYEQISAGAADRIIKMAENQSKHRISVEKSLVDSGTKNETRGMILSFIITIFLMATGAFLIYNNKDIIGFAALFTPVIFQGGGYILRKIN